MNKIIGLGWVLALALAACVEQSLPLSIRFQRVDGLKAGDAVVFREQAAGAVDAVQYDRSGLFIAEIHIAPAFRAAATTQTRFILADDPAHTGQKRIELEHSGGGDLLEPGAVVDGYDVLGLPFDQLFQGLGQGLRQFTDQLEQLQRSLKGLPDSPEGKKLKEEWERFLKQLDKTGKEAEKNWEPDIRKRLEDWDQRFRQLEPKQPAQPDKPVPSQREGYNI